MPQWAPYHFAACRAKITAKKTTFGEEAMTTAGSVGVALACVIATVAGASAQNWPSRNISAIIPFAAGNANDLTARIVLEQLQRQLGQTIVIENRPGAGGTIGVGAAARATPDGHTILVHSSSFASAYVTHKTLPYDTLNDFAAVAALGAQPSVLIVASTRGIKTAGELIAAAKAKPGELNFASAGIGAASHLAAEKFRVAADVKAQHVPFRGPVEALTEVLGGRIDYYFLPLAPALQLIKDGKIVALAVSSDKRAPQLPDVPTVGEVGLKDASYVFWNGLFLPAKTPREIVDRLNQETQKALREPSVKERLAKIGVEPLFMTPAEFDRYFKKDVADTEKLAKQAGIEKQ
jgi:tripartite-type tricarboxylate transporter receptor subunit TctC